MMDLEVELAICSYGTVLYNIGILQKEYGNLYSKTSCCNSKDCDTVRALCMWEIACVSEFIH